MMVKMDLPLISRSFLLSFPLLTMKTTRPTKKAIVLAVRIARRPLGRGAPPGAVVVVACCGVVVVIVVVVVVVTCAVLVVVVVTWVGVVVELGD